MDKERILIVEDDQITRTLFRTFFQSQEYATIEATNGIDGIKAAENEAPNLILMDIQMPEMDGMQALERLKSNPATENIPMLALTGYAAGGDRERLMAKGFDDYLSKPLDLDDLLEKVRELLSH